MKQILIIIIFYAAILSLLLTDMARSGTFTGSVLIAQDGKVLLSQGNGFADRIE